MATAAVSAAAASWRLERITPASQTARLSSGDRLRIWFILRSDRISAEPSAGGVAPPTMDVLPPCGTSGTERSAARSEEHTSELQSLMRISYAVFCLKKKNEQRTSAEKNNVQKQLETITSHN